MHDKPDLEKGIYRVSHFLILGGARYNCESDLIFLNDQPNVVLEWGGPQENQHPALMLPLDPARLEIDPRDDGYFLYQGDVVDPRKVQ